jgi:hypothetical protein
MDTAKPSSPIEHRPCWRADEGYVSAERGYWSAAAAARAIPVLNRARHRFGKAPYTHIASFGEGEACLAVRPVQEAA